MSGQDKSKQGLIEDLPEMRRRVAALERIDAERKIAEEALREREIQLFEAQEVARLGFYVLDIAAGRWTSSPVLDQILDIPADYEKTVDGWANLVHRDERQAMLDHLLKEVVGERKPCDREYRIVRYGDKQVRWVHGLGRLQLNANGQPVFMLGTIQDITERKQGEEALRQSEEALRKAHDELEQRVKERTVELAKANESLNIFRKFVEASGEGFGMADLDGTIAYANPALCRLMGEEKLEDVLGKNISAYYPEDYLQRRKDEMIPALLREGDWHTETRVLQRHGKPISVQQTSSLIRDETGNPIRTAVVISDITERKQAEEALAKEHRNLRHMLRSSDNERQLIAYEIHDGLAQQLAGAIMQFQAYGHLKDTQPKQAAKAYDAGLTMLQQGHFETRRLIAGVRPPILDEEGIVEAVAHLVHELGRDKGPKIENRSRVDFDRLDPTLENAIYRIAQEALTNACKHGKSERISVSLLQREDRLRIEIRDWGVGFDPKTAPKNRFGLEGIRQRARLLGGKCHIRSSAGKGTRITVELPVIPRDEEG
jgi:PAS domain S-box-containing protein